MSLIENVFDKARKSGIEPEPQVRPLTGPASVDLLAEAEYPHRRVTINLDALQEMGYLPEKAQERRLADFYRQIKRPLLNKALAATSPAAMRFILVSSPLPGDGKTFTSINLAMSMARERDTTMLLIDADLPKAHISRAFGLQNEPGLVDALLDETIDIESLILKTDVRGLSFLPAGKWVDGVTELLSSARMAELAVKLVSRNPRRLVLLDSSPILVSIEARALVQIPGQIVIVVRAGVTPRQAVLDAVSHVDRDKLQGLILNDAPAASGSGYYNYSYYGSADDGTFRGT